MTLMSLILLNTLMICFPHSWLSNLKQWLDSNRLSLSVLKTKCLFMETRHKISLLSSEPDICLDGHSIERVSTYKCLGMWVDETYSWDTHISEVSDKVAKAPAPLTRLRPICPPGDSCLNLQTIDSASSLLL